MPVRSMMEDNLAKVASATKKLSRPAAKDHAFSCPRNANEEQINAFKSYIERQIAANQAFVSRLLHAKNIQEACKFRSCLPSLK